MSTIDAIGSMIGRSHSVRGFWSRLGGTRRADALGLVVFAFLALFCVSASAQSVKPLLIAHRGASGYLPEHTLPAKAFAYALGADFLEQDIVLTKDDVPIVLHDI